MVNELPVSPTGLTTWLRRLIPYFLGGLGIAFMVVGIAVNYIQTKQNESVPGKTSDEIKTAAVRQNTMSIKVEASGAIEKPGVYELPYDSRVKDVLITAGGLSPKADRNYISKNINLAQRVVDGMKVYFPFIGEQIDANQQRINTNSSGGGLISINSGSEAQLDGLPGIGPVTAAKIISGRPYQTVSELLSRKIVSSSVFQKIKDLISIN